MNCDDNTGVEQPVAGIGASGVRRVGGALLINVLRTDSNSLKLSGYTRWGERVGVEQSAAVGTGASEVCCMGETLRACELRADSSDLGFSVCTYNGDRPMVERFAAGASASVIWRGEGANDGSRVLML